MSVTPMMRLGDLTIGVALFPTEPPQHVQELARLADELGYSRVYVGDSQLIWREAYVNLTVAALATSRAAVGAGVTNAITRNPTVTASAMATLDELTGGRVFLGIGLGDSSVHTMGKAPAAVRQLEQAVGVIKRLYRGERVEYDGAEVHLGYSREGRELPVLVGANGPRMLELAGRCADGAILSGGLSPGYREFNLHHLHEGAASVGRDLRGQGFHKVAWMACSISEDGPAARDAVRSAVARVVHRQLPIRLEPSLQETIDRIRREYDWYQHLAVGSRHGTLVPDELVAQFAIAGTPAECCRQMADALERGMYVDELAIVPYAADPAGKARVIRAFAEDVVGGLARG